MRKYVTGFRYQVSGSSRPQLLNRALKVSLAMILTSWLPYFLFSSLAQETKLPAPKDVIKTKAYVSLDKVPRGRAFDIAVVAEILPGFHVNSNKPSEDYLIPTQLMPDLPAGFKVLSTAYPAGKEVKFAFSEKKLSVYEGTFTLRMKLQVPARASLGAQQLPLMLRYQACNENTCLPPVKILVSVELEIAASNATARPAHPEIFKN